MNRSLRYDAKSFLDHDEMVAYNQEALDSFEIWNARRVAKVEKLNRMIHELSMQRDALIVSSWPGGLGK